MLNLRLLKISLFLLSALHIYAQEWHKIDSIELNDIPTAYASDFQGNLYFGFSDGRLTKYDFSGKLLENFSLSNNSRISLIDIQNNLKPFLFYFDNQQITILDRFSSVPKDYRITDVGLDIAMLACPSPDGNFWMIENNPQRLRKVDPLRKITILDVQLGLGDSIKQMQAYQNILVVANQSHLHILDQFAALIHTLEFDKLINFQLIKEQLFVYTDQKILEIDPYKGLVKNSMSRPSKSGPMLKSRDRLLCIKNNKVVWYSMINK